MDPYSLFSKSELSRYSRHLTLPNFGIIAQSKLKQSSVLCIGAGGLGSPLLSYLAAAGVGTIGIVDFDIVEESNLQRQIIHGVKSINHSKCNSAKQRILEINPYCSVNVYNIKLVSSNILEIIASYDVVCDGTDNFPTRYLVNDACVLSDKPYIYGSILQFEGQASVFNLNVDSPNYRDLVPEPPPPGMVPSCAEGGVVGVLPGIIGTIQATETIKVITGVGECLDGRILIFDALKMRFGELLLKKDLSLPKITKLIDYDKFCKISNIETNKVPSISVLEMSKVMKSKNKFLLLDVREIDETSICQILPSLHIPINQILEDESTIDQIKEKSLGKSIYVYCKLGGRSAKVVKFLEEKGINAINLKGGIIDWIKYVDSDLVPY